MLAQRGVSVALAGVKNETELAAALHTLEASEAERDYGSLLADFGRYVEGECTYCNHCLPCPSGIDIGNTILCVGFTQWDGVTDWLRTWYADLPAPASECIECGVCEERCPFDVEIVAKMREAAKLLEEPAA